MLRTLRSLGLRGRHRKLPRALIAGVILALTAGAGLASAVPPHDFGPVAGADPLYTAANAANPRPLLVMLVTFTDLASPAGFTEANAASRVFGPAFPNLAAYYSANSFGKMTFTPAHETCGTTNDGVVTVNVGSSATWLGQADHTENRTVLDAVNALGCVDFSTFDRNGDGTLTDDELSLLLIDATTRNCGATRAIDPGAVYNGKTIDPNRTMSMSASGANILTLAHEVGHQALGTRDLYGFGVGSFDLYGPTCGEPDTTMFEFSAWQKLHLGWLTPTVVAHDGYYDVPRADTNASAFILYDAAHGTNDYFIVENREPTSGTYDQNATDQGLVIWRADDAQYNSGTDTIRPIDIMRPDGTQDPGCTGGGCYGGSNGDAWDAHDAATPQRSMTRTWRDGTASHVAVRAIANAGASMRVYFDVPGPGVLVDTYVLQNAAPPDLTLGEAGAISFPVMNTGDATDTFDFTATGLPAGWTATTDTQTLAAGSGSTAHITITSPISATIGIHTLTAVGTSQSDSTVTSNSSFRVTVVGPPSISKSFGAATIPLSGSTSLSFTITNPNTTVGLTGVAFTDNLPAGLIVATPNGLSSTCAGTATATAGSGSVSLSGGGIAAGGSCTVGLQVTGTTAGVKNNTTGAVTSTNGGTGTTSNTATLTVVAPPTISKSFTPDTISVNGQSTLSFTITNPNSTVALTGVGFSDTLPGGVVVSTPNGRTGSCGGGTISALAGGNLVSLSGATLAASASCTFSVKVTGQSAGVLENTTDPVTSANGGDGNAATATLTVLAPDLTIASHHGGTFHVNQPGTYTLHVSNLGPGATSGPVTVTDTLSLGLAPVSVSGSGWTCAIAKIVKVTCSRSDALAAGSSYPDISLTVRPTISALGTFLNIAQVSDANDANPGNNSAIDPTVTGF